jgi:hypothetical protein
MTLAFLSQTGLDPDGSALLVVGYLIITGHAAIKRS